MRVLFWADTFWPYIGGGEIFGTKLLMALKERHEFAVITRQDSPDMPAQDFYRGIPVYRFPFCTSMASSDLGQIIALRRRIAHLKRTFVPDLVHVHNFGPSVLFHLETVDAHRKPMLFTVQLEISPYKNGGPNTLLERTLRTADWVSCVSSETLAQVRQRVAETIPRSSVIFNSLDIPSLMPQPLPTGTPRLLCLGRLSPQKGFDVAIAAFAKVVQKFPRARLIIAGDGPERADLERQVVGLQLTEAVEFLGWVPPDQVLPLINSVTLVVMPSRYEGLPLVGLEAALMARPIVASRISGLSELVLHRQTGLLTEPEDIPGLTEAIAFLLTHPEQAAQMGRAGRGRVQELFSWQQCVASYEALYHKLAIPPH
ncbi:MAG: glycosyltransferase family 4 protein [Candidatus Binatia bacterium]